jgi:hypothetical protein
MEASMVINPGVEAVLSCCHDNVLPRERWFNRLLNDSTSQAMVIPWDRVP